MDGQPGQVGSQVQITWKDGSVWKVMVLEISDLHNFVTYELVEAQPAVNASSVLNTIKLQRVSDTN